MTGRGPSTLHADEGGQISALGVLAAGIFACLLLLVINTGYATSGKIEMQNAADATAISGATWMARGLNIISMNNVTQTQLFAVLLIVRSLDDAIPYALLTLRAELYVCGLSVVAFPICGPILELQIVTMEALQSAVNTLRSTLAQENGPIWTAMKLLGRLSGAISVAFPVIGELESIRISRQNGADIGFLVPARFSVDGWPSLPVHKGSLSDICDKSREGPLPEFSGPIDFILAPWINSFIHVYFRVAKELNYRSICGGSGPVSTSTRVGSLFECNLRGGGEAVWQLVTYYTIVFDTPQPNIVFTAIPFTAPTGSTPVKTTCSWTPPGTPIGGNRYRDAVQETINDLDANGQPILRYRYRIYEYQFLAASVPGQDNSQPDVAPPPANDNNPYPYLLGGDPNSSDDVIRKELRYFSIVYRSREVPVAPAYFVSLFGEHRLAYAEARVYNPTAFDTFTQDWRVALEPVSMIEDGTLLGGLGNAGLAANVAGAAGPSLFNRAIGLFGALTADTMEIFNNH